MPSAFGRVILTAAVIFTVTFAPYVRAATTNTVQLNDPITDAIQLWSSVGTAIASLAQHLATAFPHHTSTPTAVVKPHARKSLTASAVIAEAAATNSNAPESNLAHTSEATTSSPRPEPKSRGQPTVRNTQAGNTLSVPATPSSGTFVTQDQLNAGMSALNNSLRQLIFQDISAPASVPASGGYTNNIALSNRIDNLSGVIISNATISGVSGLKSSDIPSLNYLSLSGGTLTGTLTVPTLTASNASTSLLSVYGPAYFGATATSSFNSAGALTLASPLLLSSGGTGTSKVAELRAILTANATKYVTAVLGAPLRAGTMRTVGRMLEAEGAIRMWAKSGTADASAGGFGLAPTRALWNVGGFTIAGRRLSFVLVVVSRDAQKPLGFVQSPAIAPLTIALLRHSIEQAKSNSTQRTARKP